MVAKVPVLVGRVNVGVPAAACAIIAAMPDEDPPKSISPEAVAPTLLSTPVESISQPSPFESACHGFSDDPEAVVK